MTVTVSGLVGHSGMLEIPAEQLDVQDYEPGSEFVFEGNLYEIRSVQQDGNGLRIDVVLSLIIGQA